jgi:two-component system, chemotaxis family, protein-glutamate methylesterase/glutaminase
VRDIIVVGASAGGVEALTRLVSALPADFPGSLFVTLHFPEYGTSVLPRILTRAGALTAEHPKDGEPIKRGRIYVAPPDRHLLLDPDALRVVRGPRENGSRPAIDPMFRSAALSFGPRVIGIILTGNLDDGTAGLMVVKRRGGVAIVQDPAEALFPSMPTSAAEHVKVDHTIRIDEIGPLLRNLVAEPVSMNGTRPVTDDAPEENAYTKVDLDMIRSEEEHPGKPSVYGCPDCGGVLWEIHDEDLVRYRCRVGHAWSSESLIARQQDGLEAALWTALRALEESAQLASASARRLRERGNSSLAERFSDNAHSAERRAEVIRDVLVGVRGAEERTASMAGSRAAEPPIGGSKA